MKKIDHKDCLFRKGEQVATITYIAAATIDEDEGYPIFLFFIIN